ncbi:MAG: response regulator [Pseudomonadota bacterium]
MSNNKKNKIMIVDDEVINIRLLTNILEANYSVIEVPEGKEVLEAAIINEPDLILLDIIMPKMNGYKVCQQLKLNPQTAYIPIIFLTSKNKEKDEAKGLRIGAVDYIVKPFRPQVDVQRIAIHLKLAKQNRTELIIKNNSALNAKTNHFGLQYEIRKLFKLNESEAQICNGLINGLSLEDIADDLELKYSTVRGYLSFIFHKTKTKKQHELVGHILKKLIF